MRSDRLRLKFVALALSLFAYGFSPPEAKAHPQTPCSSLQEACDEGQAYAALQGKPLEHCQLIRPTGKATSIKYTKVTNGIRVNFNCQDTC
ncbi:hypothetical protein ACWGM5_20715, partial [Bacillus velezensis]